MRGSTPEVVRGVVEACEAGRRLGGRAGARFVCDVLDDFGDRATDSAYERSFYCRDVAPLPGVIHQAFRTVPDLVVRPRDAEDVARIVQRAGSEGVAVTVRAGASSALGGVVPLRAGVVVDVSDLRGVVEVDTARKTARVRSGTVWTELERCLDREGLAPLAVPSSAPASSVGGWLCTGGYGIGSLKYGPFVSHVRSIEVVLPDGSLHRLNRSTRPPLQWFAGSEGALGVVTEVELDVREARPLRHVLVACRDMDTVLQVVDGVVRRGGSAPYSVHFDDAHVVRALHALGYAPPGWDGSHLVRIDWEEPADDAGDRRLTPADLVASVCGASLLPDEAAVAEWRERFRALRIKRGGPSVMGAEMLMPLTGLRSYLRDVQKLARANRRTLMTYGHLGSPDTVVVMTMYYSDETDVLAYALDLGLVKKLHDAGAAYGAVPYGLGVWNRPHLRPGSARVPLAELRRRKTELDPAGLMNPGKGATHLRLMNPSAVRLGMDAMVMLRRMLGRTA